MMDLLCEFPLKFHSGGEVFSVVWRMCYSDLRSDDTWLNGLTRQSH
jgi:hypothetical protein